MSNNKTIIMRHYDYINIPILTFYVNEEINRTYAAPMQGFCLGVSSAFVTPPDARMLAEFVTPPDARTM